MLELPASQRSKDVIACAEFWNFSSITSMSNLVLCLADRGKLREGSGMGMAHSGDLCDAALDCLAETWSTDPVFLREHGIRLYARFRVRLGGRSATRSQRSWGQRAKGGVEVAKRNHFVPFE